jgi:microsomal dipeptidase-like Zn-dependent dipeptidase
MDAMQRWLQRDNLPHNLMTFITGAEDVAHLPVFIEALVQRGFSDEELSGILGENALRLYESIFTAPHKSD